MKIIFLDIDGVLNCENGYRNGFCKYVGNDDFHYQQFYPPSKTLLNKLIEETDAKIVISSTWRMSGFDHMQNVWKGEEMSGEIIGLTPNFINADIPYRIPRGCEIDNWLDETGLRVIKWSKEKLHEYMEESKIENYIIIDDDSDMLYNQRHHFIHVKPSPRNKEGFNQECYNQAISILEKNLIDLYYGN